MLSVRRGRAVCTGVLALLMVAVLSPALTAQAPARTAPLQAEPPVSAPADSAPVPVPQASEKALAYYNGGVALWLIQFALVLAFPAGVLFSGFSARLRDRAARLGRAWFFTIVIYFIFYSLLGALIDLPLDFYRGFVREHAYGLSGQTLGKWIGDHLKWFLVNLAVGSAVLWVPYMLLRRSPRRWWLFTALLAIPFMAVSILISPVYIDPLFNDFRHMEDPALEGKILRLAERAGIDGGRVFQVNKSIDTKRINAYVAGLGATKRIVLWDTAIHRLDERELLFVMGHEMGHYVLGHVWKLLAFFSITILAVLFLAHRSSAWMIRRFSSRFGFRDLADVASLPLLVFLFGLLGALAMPLQLAFSRHLEHEADRFGIEITRDNRAAATSFSKFVEQNLANPRPGLFVKLFRASHPPLAERIDFANDYRPWEKGEPLKYERLFRTPAQKKDERTGRVTP